LKVEDVQLVLFISHASILNLRMSFSNLYIKPERIQKKSKKIKILKRKANKHFEFLVHQKLQKEFTITCQKEKALEGEW